MKTDDIIRELKRISIDNHRCFGCGREHSCNTRGCAIMRAAADRLGELEQLAAQAEGYRAKLIRAGEVIKAMATRGEEACISCVNKPNLSSCEFADYNCNECRVEGCVCKTCVKGEHFMWEGEAENET